MNKSPSNQKKNAENFFIGFLLGSCPSHKYNWNGFYFSLLPLEKNHCYLNALLSRITKQLETYNQIVEDI